MRICLLFLIKIYWFIKPKNKKASCIFKKSCSNYVYETTKNKGLIAGLKSLKFRVKNCSYGFELYKNLENNKI